MPHTIDITWNGIDLLLDADRAIVLREARALLVADVHLGKAATFRAHACPVPEAVTDADLDRLSALVERHDPACIYVLGDLFHAPQSLGAGALQPFRTWRAGHDLPLTLVRGNHDRRAGDAPADLSIRTVNGPTGLSGLDLVHEPPASPARPTLAGHVHPGVSLRARFPRGGLRAPCFHFSAAVGVLPAFSRFTGAESVRARSGDRIFAVGEGAVIEVSPRAR